MVNLEPMIRATVRDLGGFSSVMQPGRTLRSYQLPVGRAVVRSIERGEGMEYAAVFSRQSGKDEMLAQVCAYLLWRNHQRGGQIVVALPTLRPQGMISRDRLVERLSTPLTRELLRVRDGSIVQLGRASVRFLSASPSANGRGNTADLLLVANEAQDIDPDTWDAVFSPMAASTNAVILYMGTVWSSQTLLARQLRILSEQERRDGVRRVYRVPWREVERELPAYGDYVRRQMDLLGESHPFIRTEYELEELDGDGHLFPPERREPLVGSFKSLARPSKNEPPGIVYAFTVDVAGEEESGVEGELARRSNPRRDSTALSVFRVITDATLPRYELVARYLWTGTRQTALHDRIVRLARLWDVQRIVIDATGVGAGLASFLRATLGERKVTPFVFSSRSKSQLAWDLLGLVDGGRVRICDPGPGDDLEQRRLHNLFMRQLAACRYTVLPGPGKVLRWSVEDQTLHDDLLVSFALVAALDGVDWRPRAARGHWEQGDR